MRHVKFWTFSATGALVKIKMRAGDTFRHHWGARTDEGWSSEDLQFSFDGVRVTCETFTEGVDCDGRMQRFGESFFFAGQEHQGTELAGVRFPKWQSLASGQRDYTAEAAGY
jgi:hypothetical protein